MAGESFTLPNEEIEVRYIKRATDMIKDPRHVAYGGLLEGSTKTYPIRMLRNGNYANILTNEEKEYLENRLGLDKNGLSVYNKGDKDYWKHYKVKLSKEGTFLKLYEPEDYIKYKVLLSYDDQICNNIAEIDHKNTYKFVIVRKNDEAKLSSKKVDLTKEAYKLYGKIEDSREAMIDFLRVSGKKVSDDTTSDALNALVGKELTDDTKKFVETLKDPSYTTRVLLHKGIAVGEVVKRGTNYYSKDGTPLAEPGQTSTIGNTIAYLENNLYQEYRLHLIAKTK
jgi:hypothetical protein